MQLTDLFSPECIKLGLVGTTKIDVFKELIDLLVGSCKLDCADEILEAICEREKKISTGIREGIAIPHGKARRLHGIYGVMGISVAGIDYDALDGKSVKLVFLVVSSENESDQHLEILKKIALCVEHQDFYGHILEAESPERISEILADVESPLERQGQDSVFANRHD